MKGDGFSWPGCLVSSCDRTSQANPQPREGVCLLLPAQVPKPFGEAAEEAQGWVGWSWFRPTLRGGGKEHRCSSILLPCKERAALPVTPLPPFTPLSCSLQGYLPWAHSPSCVLPVWKGKSAPVGYSRAGCCLTQASLQAWRSCWEVTWAVGGGGSREGLGALCGNACRWEWGQGWCARACVSVGSWEGGYCIYTDTCC